jgi:hypothetical protein
MPFNPQDMSGKTDDCFRQCVAYVLDVSAKRVKYHTPQVPAWLFYWNWEEYIKERFNKKMIGYHGSEIDLLMREEKWIAIVPSFFNDDGPFDLTHAVVMKGTKLDYDPCIDKPRKQKPKKIFRGFALVNA